MMDAQDDERKSDYSFRVHGIPVTQGSARAFLPPGTKLPIVTHDNRAELRSWRDAVASEALRVRGGNGLLDGPVAVTLRFYLPIPRSRPRRLRTHSQARKWTWPWRRPDLDKLQRAAMDALIGVLLKDDGQVVRFEARKAYDEIPGLDVVIEQLV